MWAELGVGQTVAGKYVVERLLGQGGMGMVVLARHAHLGQQVAIKAMLGDVLQSPEARERFLREARASAALQSEYVAHVSDVGVLPSGIPYMVMEYVEGQDLARALHARGPLPIAEAADCVIEACTGLSEAHAAGIVHRDLKPSNLFLARRPDGSQLIKILDFGIAKAPVTLGRKITGVRAISPQAHTQSSSLTSTGAMGSPQYMAPEQFESAKDVDARADVWALGVILYELLTGKRPFEGDSLQDILIAIATTQPAPLRSLRPDVPEALSQVVARCLVAERERRLPSVGRLAWELAAFASPRGAAVSGRAARLLGEALPDSYGAPPPPSMSLPQNGPVVPVAPTMPMAPPSFWKRYKVPLLAGLGLLLVGSGVVAGMGLLGAGCLGYLMLQTSVRTEAFPSGNNPSSVDAVDMYPAARAFAQKLEPHAKLRSILVEGAKGGTVDLSSHGRVVYLFQYSYKDAKGETQEGDVKIRPDRVKLAGERMNIGGDITPEMPEPRCSLRKVWAAAGGTASTKGDLAIGGEESTKAWKVTFENGQVRHIDASTCAVVQGK